MLEGARGPTGLRTTDGTSEHGISDYGTSDYGTSDYGAPDDGPGFERDAARLREPTHLCRRRRAPYPAAQDPDHRRRLVAADHGPPAVPRGARRRHRVAARRRTVDPRAQRRQPGRPERPIHPLGSAPAGTGAGRPPPAAARGLDAAASPTAPAPTAAAAPAGRTAADAGIVTRAPGRDGGTAPAPAGRTDHAGRRRPGGGSAAQVRPGRCGGRRDARRGRRQEDRGPRRAPQQSRPFGHGRRRQLHPRGAVRGVGRRGSRGQDRRRRQRTPGVGRVRGSAVQGAPGRDDDRRQRWLSDARHGARFARRRLGRRQARSYGGGAPGDRHTR